MSEQTSDGMEKIPVTKKVTLTSSAKTPKLYNADPKNPPDILVPRSGGKPPSRGTVTQIVDLGGRWLASTSFNDPYNDNKESVSSVSIVDLEAANPGLLFECIQEKPRPGIIERIGNLVQEFRNALDQKLS